MNVETKLFHRISNQVQAMEGDGARAYVVSLATTAQEDGLFGRFADGGMQLNDWGRLVEESWVWLAAQVPCLDLDAWAVMPNHFHGILWVQGVSEVESQKTIGRLTDAFKAVSSRRINRSRGTLGEQVWQPLVEKRKIANEAELSQVRQNIFENPSPLCPAVLPVLPPVEPRLARLRRYS